eukprot:1179646-Prorocentrum_minimum.AAC.1
MSYIEWTAIAPLRAKDDFGGDLHMVSNGGLEGVQRGSRWGLEGVITAIAPFRAKDDFGGDLHM